MNEILHPTDKPHDFGPPWPAGHDPDSDESNEDAMSDKITEVRTASGAAIQEHGHVARAEALERARVHFARQRLQAEVALSELADGQVKVYHQLGTWVVKNRREVEPAPACKICGDPADHNGIPHTEAAATARKRQQPILGDVF